MLRSVMHQAAKAVVLFCIGAVVYALIEILWRGYTHWTMAVLGGSLFLLIGGINNWLPWDMPLCLQAIIGSLMVTGAEFIAGLILNIWLELGIWDYSQMPFNILGQICPQFMAAWAGLSVVAILLDDYVRYIVFGEEKPHYKLI